MERPRMFSKCINCVHRVTILDVSGCTHIRGGHTIKNINTDRCIYFKCEWCNKNRCICKRSDFY